MDSSKQFINSLLHIVIQLGNVLMGVIIAAEVWLRGALAKEGLPPEVQTAVMLLAAVLLIGGAVRMFGGLIRIAVMLILLLIAAHIILPVLPA